MNIPQLPTDSLYKFMALAGVVVTLVSLILPSYQVFELERQILAVETDFAVLKERRSHLQEEKKEILSEATELQRDYDEELKRLRNASQKVNDALVVRREALKKRHDEFRAKGFELITNGLLLQGKNQEVGLLLKWTRRSIYAMLIGGIAGTLLSYAGFLLWYRRVQVHQDTLLRKQLEKSET